MKPIVFLIICLAGLSCSAQTAKVIPLSDSDAAERKSLEDQREAIEQKIKDFDQRVREHYTTVLEGEKDASYIPVDSSLGINSYITVGCGFTLSTDPVAEKKAEECEKALAIERAKNPPPKRRMYRLGWEYGVIYSEDWKFIIPQEAPKWTPGTSGGIPLWYGTCGSSGVQLQQGVS